jgi:DNA-binding NarL/FixJ family response regulator
MRVLLVDDHAIVRHGVCAILSSREDIEVCGEAGDGKEALQKAVQLKPDLIVMDITMPLLSGFDASVKIRKVLPDVPILILSMHDSQTVRQACRRAGAQGYVSKAKAGEILLRAVDLLMDGETFFPVTESA